MAICLAFLVVGSLLQKGKALIIILRHIQARGPVAVTSLAQELMPGSEAVAARICVSILAQRFVSVFLGNNFSTFMSSV